MIWPFTTNKYIKILLEYPRLFLVTDQHRSSNAGWTYVWETLSCPHIGPDEGGREGLRHVGFELSSDAENFSVKHYVCLLISEVLFKLNPLLPR